MSRYLTKTDGQPIHKFPKLQDIPKTALAATKYSKTITAFNYVAANSLLYVSYGKKY
jgi:hypothetical protein